MNSGHAHPRSPAIPYLMVNMAITADGKIATANRALSSFGSEQDQTELLRLRTQADALMSGARTADLNPITLDSGGEKFRRLRLRQGRAPEPVRVLVSGAASLNPEAEVFRRRSSPIIVLTTSRAPRRRVEKLQMVADEVRSFGAAEIDFRSALEWLRRTYGVERLLCEGGGALNDALFRAGLVDEVHLTVCPFVFGGREAPTIADGIGAAKLTLAQQFALHTLLRRGNELFLVCRKLKATEPRLETPGLAHPQIGRTAKANRKVDSKR